MPTLAISRKGVRLVAGRFSDVFSPVGLSGREENYRLDLAGAHDCGFGGTQVRTGGLVGDRRGAVARWLRPGTVSVLGVRARSLRWRSHTGGAVLLAFLGRRNAETGARTSRSAKGDSARLPSRCPGARIYPKLTQTHKHAKARYMHLS